jgi:hypothetical protein
LLTASEGITTTALRIAVLFIPACSSMVSCDEMAAIYIFPMM